MAVVRIDLWAKKGNLYLPGKTIPFYGFSESAAGPPKFPGPTILAKEGDIINVRLFNNPGDNIDENTSIMFPGQENVMTRVMPNGSGVRVSPQYSAGKMISLTNYVSSNQTPGREYSFEAEKPGIYLYESGTNIEKQIQMGLYGAIVVMPRGYNISNHPNYKKAYGANTRSDYDLYKILVIGEIDSTMHTSVQPGVYYNMLEYKPDYFIINGRCYPDTVSNDNNNMPQPYGSKIDCRAGQKVLIRIINAGFLNHTLYFGGLMGRIIAEDSFPLRRGNRDRTYEKMGITIGSGKSFDVILTPTNPREFYIYDREYNHLVNKDEFPGGMMTLLNVTP